MKTFATLNAAIHHWARQDGDKTFCYLKPQGGDDFVAISYRQLVQRAGCFQRAYQNLNVERRAPVLIILEHGESMLYAFVGALLGGFVPSFLAPVGERQDPAHYWSQLQVQWARMHGGLLVTSEGAHRTLRAHLPACQIPVLTSESVSIDSTGVLDISVAPDDIALLQHSSGTTGGRKGVALTHRAIMHQLCNYSAAIRLAPDDVIASWLPLYHDMGLISSFLLPLASGVPVVMISAFEWVNRPRMLLDAIREFGATLAWLPNFAFHHLARLKHEPGEDLRSLRALINCSEPCKQEAFDQFLTRYADAGVQRSTLQICYAMAEMVFAATQTVPAQTVKPASVERDALLQGKFQPSDDADAVALMPVGQAIQDVTIQCVDEAGRAVAEGMVGEIVLQAPFLFSGYYNDPELTAQAFCEAGYRTGDLGAWHAGQLYITGRKKDLIIVNGRNYYAHDIEAIVSTVAQVKPGRCVAFGLFNDMIGSETICVLAESDCVDSKGLSVQIKAALQRDMGIIIGKAVVVPPRWLIKTTSGKISRAANKEKYLAGLVHPPTPAGVT